MSHLRTLLCRFSAVSVRHNNHLLSSYSMASIARLSNSELNSRHMSTEPGGKATIEQLTATQKALNECVVKFFHTPHNYRLYNINVIFEDNIRGVQTQGISEYVKQLSLVRLGGHLRYAHVKMEVLKSTVHTDDGTVRMRWRVAGIRGFRVFLFFWKFRFWSLKEMLSKNAHYIDGFSVFYVGSDGLIYKHIADKMMPDDNKEPVTNPLLNSVRGAAKAAPSAAAVTTTQSVPTKQSTDGSTSVKSLLPLAVFCDITSQSDIWRTVWTALWSS